MDAGAKDDIHAILPTIFSATNTALGVWSFCWAHRRALASSGALRSASVRQRCAPCCAALRHAVAFAMTARRVHSRILKDARAGELFAHRHAAVPALAPAPALACLSSPARPARRRSLWVAAYTAFSAILGMGYARFLYSGDHVAWRAGQARPYLAFFGCEVFLTLVAMGVVLLPGGRGLRAAASTAAAPLTPVCAAIYLPQRRWFAETCLARGGGSADRARAHQGAVLRHVAKAYALCTALVALGYTATVMLLVLCRAAQRRAALPCACDAPGTSHIAARPHAARPRRPAPSSACT